MLSKSNSCLKRKENQEKYKRLEIKPCWLGSRIQNMEAEVHK
jgi:hypothetical protein